MDPEITSLAQGAGATLVTLMATDTWQALRAGITRLWSGSRPDRVDVVAAELAADREDVLAAEARGDNETLADVRTQWQARFRRLLAEHPEAAAELRRLLDELDPQGAAGATTALRATASGHARIYQAGRDQHITER